MKPDQGYMIAQSEDTTMQVDPLVADDPWACSRTEPTVRRQSSGASSSRRSWIPMQIPTAISLGASTVTTLDTASTVQALPTPPAVGSRTRSARRGDIQEMCEQQWTCSQRIAADSHQMLSESDQFRIYHNDYNRCVGCQYHQ